MLLNLLINLDYFIMFYKTISLDNVIISISDTDHDTFNKMFFRTAVDLIINQNKVLESLMLLIIISLILLETKLSFVDLDFRILQVHAVLCSFDSVKDLSTDIDSNLLCILLEDCVAESHNRLCC